MGTLALPEASSEFLAYLIVRAVRRGKDFVIKFPYVRANSPAVHKVHSKAEDNGDDDN